MLLSVIDSVTLLALGALWGGMLFFAAVYAPLVFIKLEAAVAGPFIRQVFPVYYLAMGITSAVAACALAFGSKHTVADVVALALVCAGFMLVRQVLMPRINRDRDAELAGDAAAGKRFHRGHQTSVAVNALQLLTVLVVLVRFVIL
ncbi:MAG: DUF4149 domain-containing protein [Pseudomonadota bacterium]